MRRLCARICSSSTQRAGVDAWTASLRGSRASRTAWRGSGLERTMIGTYGRGRLRSLGRLNRSGCFWRTLEEAPDIFASELGRNWSEWVTGLRRDYSARQRLVRGIGGSDCSCWPTARTVTGGGESGERKRALGREESGGGDLQAAAAQWDTPKASHADKGGPNMRDSSGRSQLSMQASQWTTPQAHDVRERGKGQVPSAKAGNACLARDASQWQTPAVADTQGGRMTRSGERSGELMLKGQAAQWATPKTATGDYCYDRGDHESVTMNLQGQAKAWPMPKGRDVKGESQRGEAAPMDALPNMACHFSPPGRTIPGGPSSSPSGPTLPPPSKRRLNPLFVSWLMGFPIGWTNCDVSGMPWCLFKRRMRSWFWRVVCLRTGEIDR